MAGGQPTSSSFYLHIHKPPTPVGCARQPPLSPVPVSAAGLVCQMVPCTKKGQEASLTQRQAPGCLGRKQENQNHFLIMALCAQGW